MKPWKNVRSIILLFGLVQALASIGQAQPFVYDAKIISEKYEIDRMNLATNAVERFFGTGFSDLSYVSVGWDDAQEWVYFTYSRGRSDIRSTMVINVSDTSIHHIFPKQGSFHELGSEMTMRGKRLLDGIVYNRIARRFYVGFFGGRNDGVGWVNDPKNYIYDATSFALVDSLAGGLPLINEGASLSSDGTSLFVEEWDVDHVVTLFRLDNQSMISRMRELASVADPSDFKIVCDSRNGMFLLSYLWPKNSNNGYYVVYDLNSDVIVAKIKHDENSFGYLSANSRFVVIEDTPPNPDPSTSAPSNLSSGRLSVFDAWSGDFLQNFSLPSDGRVLVFENYPNMLYYHLPKEGRSIVVDLSRLVRVKSLNPSSVWAGGGSFALSVNGRNFVSGLDVCWNGLVRRTSFTSDTLLQASILANDIAAVDSPLVTVKSPDGAESNAVRFYVRQQLSEPGLLVKLISSTATNLTGGSLQYYDGSWKDAVNNNDGTFHVNTTLASVSLRMTYEGASQTKSNVAVGPDVVVFQTVNTQVRLQNSAGALIDTGAVQYYYSSWKTLGQTINGVASKELLPANYTFRMSYVAATLDKQQDIGANPVVVFTTVNAAVQLKNSQGNLIDQGTVQYYFSSWQNLGSTTNGVAMKELLPGNYTFRMAYASATNDKQQNIGTNPTVLFTTVNAAVQLKNSARSFIDQGTVQYYFSSWQSLGTTTNGVATKELLPGNYTFRMSYASATNDKQQDIGTDPTVVFTTVNASVQLKNSLGSFIDQGTVQYYFSSWQTLGPTINGVATKELLPASYTFRMAYETVTNDKVQDISTNSTVSFSTVLCTVTVKNGQGQPVDGAQVSYYFSSWVPIGATVGGQVTKELLPATLTFRETLGSATQNKAQNIGTSSLVEFVVQ